MGEEGGPVRVSDSNVVDHTHNDDLSRQLDIYPLSCYYFGSKEAIPFKDETLADRVQRLNSNYAAHGLRTCVEAVILVELFKHPHILLLQVRNCIFKLPGGRLRPGELEIDGLKRKLSRKLCVNADADGIAWEVGECLDVWWRPEFETLPCRDLLSTDKNPKAWLLCPNWVSKKHKSLCLCNCAGVHKTLSCKVARKSQVHCTQKPKIAGYSIVPDQQKSRDVWTYYLWCSRAAIRFHLQHYRSLRSYRLLLQSVQCGL